MPDLKKLIAVMEEARALIGRPGNDFAWSWWDNSAAALAEFDSILATLRSGQIPASPTLEVYFAPTGPLQEISLSSGWGQLFLELADRFDQAMASREEPVAAIDHGVSPEDCSCLAAPSNRLQQSRSLGMDGRFAEVSLLICPDCGRHWLRYFYEAEWYSRSGRWYLGAIAPEQSEALTVEETKGMLERMPWYFRGGSWFDGEVGKSSGAIDLRP